MPDNPDNRDQARVLLAVDSPTTALFARALLERWGHQVTPVPCTIDAVQAALAARFDLAIIAAAAPDAAAVCALWRQGATAALPVIALRTDGQSLPGATAYAAVPFSVEVFHDTVQACLGGVQPASAVGSGIDTAVIVELWGSVDNGGFLTVVAVFVVELRDRLAAIAAALQGGAREALEREAHSIKGAASNVGASAIRDCAEALERQARTGADDVLRDLARKLRAATEQGIPALEALIQARRHR